MEYILDELLRQRKALATLMKGDSPAKQEDGGEESADGQNDGEMAPAEAVWNGFAEMAGEESGYRVSALRDGRGSATGRTAWNALPEGGADERTDRRLGRFYASEQTFAGGSKLSGGAEAVETVSVRTITQWDGGTVERGAKALSRAVQRDARRYDGGFAAR